MTLLGLLRALLGWAWGTVRERCANPDDKDEIEQRKRLDLLARTGAYWTDGTDFGD